MDRIRTDTDSDISDNHICVSFQFPSLRMETDQIRTDTDSDISDNHICVSFQFPSLRMKTDQICTDTNSDISDILGYPFSCLLTVSIPFGQLLPACLLVASSLAGVWGQPAGNFTAAARRRAELCSACSWPRCMLLLLPSMVTSKCTDKLSLVEQTLSEPNTKSPTTND